MVVGLMNTGVTALVIFCLMYANYNLYIANAIGYVAGIIFSFFVNSLFTFKTGPSIRNLAKFLIACGIAYITNILPIKMILFLSPDYKIFAQLVGMIIYTITGFILNRYWVMK